MVGFTLQVQCNRHPHTQNKPPARPSPPKSTTIPPIPSQCIDRRTAIISFALTLNSTLLPTSSAKAAANDAVQAGLSKYVKKKKLDRIDTYLAPLIEAKGQLIRVGRVMLQEPGEARKLLRSGIFAGLRDDVRAVGEYASQKEGENAATGTALVSGFFKPLEQLDYLLNRDAKQGKPGDGEEERKALEETIVGLEALLYSAPDSVLKRAQSVVDSFKESDQKGNTSGDVPAVDTLSLEGDNRSGSGNSEAELQRLSKLL
jgi:hypothetical protein